MGLAAPGQIRPAMGLAAPGQIRPAMGLAAPGQIPPAKGLAALDQIPAAMVLAALDQPSCLAKPSRGGRALPDRTRERAAALPRQTGAATLDQIPVKGLAALEQTAAKEPVLSARIRSASGRVRLLSRPRTHPTQVSLRPKTPRAKGQPPRTSPTEVCRAGTACARGLSRGAACARGLSRGDSPRRWPAAPGQLTHGVCSAGTAHARSLQRRDSSRTESAAPGQPTHVVRRAGTARAEGPQRRNTPAEAVARGQPAQRSALPGQIICKGAPRLNNPRKAPATPDFSPRGGASANHAERAGRAGAVGPFLRTRKGLGLSVVAEGKRVRRLVGGGVLRV